LAWYRNFRNDHCRSILACITPDAKCSRIIQSGIQFLDIADTGRLGKIS
jgi:hypothetical protein